MKFKQWFIENAASLRKLGLNPDDFTVDDQPDSWLRRTTTAKALSFDNPDMANVASSGMLRKYVALYNAAMEKHEVEIYRAMIVNLDANSRPLIDWSNLGIFWSMVASGASTEATSKQHPVSDDLPAADIMLTGIVDPKRIDWKYSFVNFSTWQPHQFEVALYPGTPIRVTKMSVDGREHSVSINADSGNGGSWMKNRQSQLSKIGFNL